MEHLEELPQTVEAYKEQRVGLEKQLMQARAHVKALEGRISGIDAAIAELEGKTAPPSKDYAHLKRIDSVLLYLERNGGGPVHIESVLFPALVEGGAEIDHPRHIRQSIKKSLKHNPNLGLIYKEKPVDTVALVKR